MQTNKDAVWFITGCSTGFGRELARETLERGWRVVVAARSTTQVEDIVKSAGSRAMAVELDVANPASCDAAIQAATTKFGSIDVLVNNAGVGYFSSAEEADLDSIRNMFEVNFFGPARLIQLVLPGMRGKKNGAIVNVGSIAGYSTRPSIAYYAATKHAIEGLCKSLAQEVEPLGIQVMCVEPGGFRTEFSNRPLNGVPTSIDDYRPTVGAGMDALLARRRNQPGDPVRGARVIVDAITSLSPPHHLVLGAQAYSAIKAVSLELLEEMEKWRDIGLSADFPIVD
jgi:NAD(P)-dependent dehydrogenase (short-subunit alcohol dehydrogenase family)